MKKTCIVYGNCQIQPLRQYLISSTIFNRTYEMINIPPVYLCNRETGLDDYYLKKLYNCDLFIYQKVSPAYSYYLSDEYIISKLPKSCILISFSNTYFNGYHPQYVHGKIDPYGDKNIIRFLNEGKSKKEIISILSDDNFYSFHDVVTNFHITLDELKRREAELDVTLDDYIEQNYRDIHLFYTINHPNYRISRYLAIKILTKLGMPTQEISQMVIPSELSRYMQPIYPSVIKHLNINFVRQEERYYTFDRHFTSFNPPILTFQECLSSYIDLLISTGELQG
ncbi:WcbI family polysaccharide biosynthesis putative acetyltransferase [Ectobacillus antri]|uniref:WcbI family polysaccharide biosynthesis putative acetyltransferase n=1 Tax=Ectobacillus antri TaxID=2486280 RepID=A0ABT6H3Q1_9BACI|nr:WcbI family polysaccharide biosynthesis putative acetyltransferase [Ectobacillus antri]MDG4656631.1 WcbI family polysaccharide biosynthesis putative acetyltransferase [Ectobacillus antri]MDG5754006.1 WcbI family polysaccharide biosynthesis putative acetyltransferase [Ectobacillus antri]